MRTATFSPLKQDLPSDSAFRVKLVCCWFRLLVLNQKCQSPSFQNLLVCSGVPFKRLFRNGRIIGRRFKLVHVVYGSHVIETATFRADPETEETDDLLIVEDNTFGTAAEDASRRDFTINGLFLEPFQRRVIDYVGGLEDLEAGVLRTIGDPEVRMAEDPVRILRA